MQLGGWRSERVVKRYSHLSADYLRAAVERLASGAMVGAPLHSGYTAPPASGYAVPQTSDAPVAQVDRASDF